MGQVIRIITFLMLLTPIGAIAANSYTYAGIDFTSVKSDDGLGTRDTLLVLGFNGALDHLNGVIFEAAVQDQKDSEGLLIKGSILYRRNILTKTHYTPYVAGGMTSLLISKESCGYRLESSNPTPIYAHSCHSEHNASNGVTLELGVTIKRPQKNSLIIKASSYLGNRDTYSNALSFGFTF